MTLRLRLLLVLVGIVATGLVVSDVVTYSSLHSFLVARLEQQLRAAPGPVANDLELCQRQRQEIGGDSSKCDVPAGTSVPPGTYGQLRTTDGQILLTACFFNSRVAKSAHIPAHLPVESTSRKAPIFPVTKTGCGASTYQGVATLIPNPDGFGSIVVLVAVPLTSVNQTLGRLLRVEGLVSLAVLIGLGGLSWWIVRRGLRPLDEMATTAGAIASGATTSGDLSQRVADTDSHTEVGRLGLALNTMLSEIESAFAARAASEERLRRFLADASHELRTPLTSIRGYSEIFEHGASDRPEDLALSMRHIRSEANRMSELVDDLLLLARLDRERPLEHEHVELTAVVAAAVDAARVKAPDRVVSFAPVSPVVVIGDANRLRQVVDNLVANALSHTPAGTPVNVGVRADGDSALLTVADQGPGIPPDERTRIFEPFHRADPSRARATGGVGLGLAIVSAIAHAHGGTVGVESPGAESPGAEPPTVETPVSSASTLRGPGATFWVRLPLARIEAVLPVTVPGPGAVLPPAPPPAFPAPAPTSPPEPPPPTPPSPILD